MAVFSITSSFIVLFFGLYILHALPSCGRAQNFSTEIIHPESPLYDPTSIPSSRFGASVHRSAVLDNNLGNTNSNNSRLLVAPKSNSIYFEGMGHEGQLLLKLELGTPNQIAWVILSTIDYLTWVMCHPCVRCGKLADELFNPNASTTYKTVPCVSNSCESINRFTCLNDEANCTYEMHYVEGLTGRGILSKETLGFNQRSTDKFIVQDVLFGCTHQINGEKPEYEIFPTGFIGLNDNKLSIINQLFYTKKIPRKFSFCIPFVGKFSRIYFGNTPAASTMITTTATLFIGQFDNLYYVHLRKISIHIPGDTSPLQIAVEQEKAPPHSRIDGNIYIDTATQVTFIGHYTMLLLSESILARFPRDRVPVPENLRHVIDLCFDWREPDVRVLPTISFHLVPGNGVISGSGTFVQVEKGVLCLLVASTKHSNGKQIIGSGVMVGNRFEIDLVQKVVKIEASSC